MMQAAGSFYVGFSSSQATVSRSVPGARIGFYVAVSTATAMILPVGINLVTYLL